MSKFFYIAAAVVSMAALSTSASAMHKGHHHKHHMKAAEMKAVDPVKMPLSMVTPKSAGKADFNWMGTYIDIMKM